MKILLVSLDNSEKALIGGKHIHQELIKKGWRESGHHVDMIYPRGKKWYFFRFLRKINLLLGLISQYEYLRRGVEADRRIIENLLAELIRQSKYDIISAQDVVAAIAVQSAFARSGQKPPRVVLTLHGYFARESINYGQFNEEDQPKVMNYCTKIERQALQFVSAVVTVDSRIRQYIQDDLSFSKSIKVITNAIDDNRFIPVGEQEKGFLRRKLKINSIDMVLIVARRLVNKNGVLYAVQAMHRLKESDDLQKYNMRLLIIGRGPEKRNITEYIAQKNLEHYVSLVGLVPHNRIDAYYKAADIVLMPSINSNGIEEATSLSMLEGMACGKMVIASAIGGLKEVIVNGENGLLVKDKDADAMAEAIMAVTRSEVPVQDIKKSAEAYAKKNAGYREHSLKFISFFENLRASSEPKQAVSAT